MSDENQNDGYALYADGDHKTRLWFLTQWRIWPKRADERFTTNISFLTGGVLAYRALNEGRDPPMSPDFQHAVEFVTE